MLHILVCLALFVATSGEDIDLDLTVDRTDWIDPNDPFSSASHCSKSTLDQLSVCKMGLEECLKDTKREISVNNHMGKYFTQDPTLRHIIRNFLSRMHVDIDTAKYVDRTVEVYVSAGNLAILRDYLNSKEETVSQREQVRMVLEELIVPGDYENLSLWQSILDRISSFLPILNIVIVVPALLILCRSFFSTFALIWLIFFVSFMISVFNTYQRMYQENFAAKMSRAEKSVTERCQSKGLLSSALEMASGLFFIKQKSECLQYYEDLYIDPMYKISPLDVISDVLSNFLFTPLSIFGRHFNAFFNEFYRDSPLHIVVVKTFTFIFLVTVFLFWISGYRLRTLFATLEPAGVRYTFPRLIQPPSDGSIHRIRAQEPKAALQHASTGQIELKSRNDSNSGYLRRRSLSASRLKVF